MLVFRIEKKVGSLILLSLDLALVQHGPEGFSAAFVETYCEFCPFAALVFPTGHLPSLLRFADFLLTLRAFSH
jgi:hypothetical protein